VSRLLIKGEMTMADQPLNTAIKIYRRLRAQRLQIREDSIKNITANLRPLWLVVPGQEILTGYGARTAGVTDFSSFMGQQMPLAGRGFPVVVGAVAQRALKSIQSISGTGTYSTIIDPSSMVVLPGNRDAQIQESTQLGATYSVDPTNACVVGANDLFALAGAVTPITQVALGGVTGTTTGTFTADLDGTTATVTSVAGATIGTVAGIPAFNNPAIGPNTLLASTTGAQTAYSVHAPHRLVRDAYGNVVEGVTHDAYGNVITPNATHDSFGNVVTPTHGVTRDAAGNVVAQTDGVTRDAAGNVIFTNPAVDPNAPRL
jgi:hypothetical protein